MLYKFFHSQFQELESLLSEHFGRTPTASQASVEEEEENHTHLDSDSTDEEDRQIPGTDERARQFLDALSDQQSTDSEDSDNEDKDKDPALTDDDPDVDKIKTFLRTKCGCTKNCSDSLTHQDIYVHILNVREMERSDKEMYIMASLAWQEVSE